MVGGGLVLASVAEAHAALSHATDQVMAAEIAQAVAIAAACDLHRVDDTIMVEGAERWVSGGAAGTPLIGEFVAAEIAGILRVSVGTAFHRIGQVLNLRHRHPRLWAVFLAGGVRFWQAARVAELACGLDVGACDWVDRQCAVALRVWPWQRVAGQVPGWVLQADPGLAADQAARAAGRRGVWVQQVVAGHCEVTGRLDAGDGRAFDEALAMIADVLPGNVPRDHRRAAAVGHLARAVLGQPALPVSAAMADKTDHFELPPTGASTDRPDGVPGRVVAPTLPHPGGKARVDAGCSDGPRREPITRAPGGNAPHRAPSGTGCSGGRLIDQGGRDPLGSVPDVGGTARATAGCSAAQPIPRAEPEPAGVTPSGRTTDLDSWRRNPAGPPPGQVQWSGVAVPSSRR